MKSLPKLSIVIPAYNASGTIERAIRSALGQTLPAVEVIVIDDASDDRTYELASAIACIDSRLILHRFTSNKGPSASRNKGIELARADWIGLLDSDDAWKPTRAAELLLLSAGADFIADNPETYDAVAKCETGLLFEPFSASVLDLQSHLSGNLGGMRIASGLLKPLIRKAFLSKHHLAYEADVRHGEDMLLYTESLCLGARFVLTQSTGYLYTLHFGRASGALSPHSKTKPDGVTIGAHLQNIKNRYVGGLSEAELESLSRSIEEYLHIDSWWEFQEHVWQRDYGRACNSIFKSSVVRKKLLAAMMHRMRIKRD